MILYFKYVVVGAGISGLTMAERIASCLNEKVLVIEKRSHIGGNCYDYYNDDGILIHQYGPHIFHTSMKHVFDYLSEFTQWDIYQHRVLAYVDGAYLPMPICARTINMLYNLNLSTREVEDFLKSVAQGSREIKSSEDVVISKAGKYIYEKFFKYYTIKQWDMDPSALDPSVISRVPVRFSIDERYFTDPYQGMPRAGYTRMFENMVKSPLIKILLNTNYKEVIKDLKYDRLIYTGPVDEFYGNELGALKYRSVNIVFETKDTSDYQPAAVVNYPNDYDFTRITEYTKLTGQRHTKTVISKEYPTWDGEPYYPVPSPAQQALYAEYKRKADAEPNTLFLGRLATYKYYNIDAAVNAALCLFNDHVKK
ncbi:MAG: UDP-galactopyranose mutase [Christensenellales bacterium]